MSSISLFSSASSSSSCLGDCRVIVEELEDDPASLLASEEVDFGDFLVLCFFLKKKGTETLFSTKNF